MRSIPSITYVRALLGRTRPAIAIALHAVALLIGANLAYLLLFGRAAWGLASDAPPAKTIGWREVAWGAVTIVLLAINPSRMV
jgi:hypothetical protein